MKINKRDIIQVVKDKKTGLLKRIVHPFQPKLHIHSSRWMQKHFGGFGRKLDNKWRPPIGKDLQKEKQLISEKKSNLSRKQRETIMNI